MTPQPATSSYPASSNLQGGAILQLASSHSAFLYLPEQFVDGSMPIRPLDHPGEHLIYPVCSLLGAGLTHDHPHLPLTPPRFWSLVLPVAAALPLPFHSFCSLSSFWFLDLCSHSKSRTRCARSLDADVEEENSAQVAPPLHCEYIFILYFMNG